MVMRVGGLATGMDVQSMVEKLMEAERMPLNRFEQQKQTLEWKRDAFRDINRTLLDFDNMMYDMKLTTAYNSKTVTSTQESAVTGTGASSATNGSININVTQIATNEMHVGGKNSNLKLDSKVDVEEIKFTTFNKSGEENKHTVKIEEGDTLKDVLKRISDADNNVRAFYDESADRVVFETTRTGKYNLEEAGTEIIFGDSQFFKDIKMVGGEGDDKATIKHATNAKFTYNDGLEIESTDNNYRLNGVTLNFTNVTDGNAQLSVTTDVESSFDKIVAFVDKYNELIGKMNDSINEERFRDFAPLTDEQRKAMSDDEVERWEEKAMSGILRGDNTLRDGMYNVRASLQSVSEADGAYKLMSQIGISTSANYLDGGQLVIEEDKLREALTNNPDEVYKLFADNGDGTQKGLIYKLDKALDETKLKIENQAGKPTHTLENYSIGKRMKEIDTRISDFERKMIQVEQRYWNQFTQMEKMIGRLNQQSDQMFSMLG